MTHDQELLLQCINSGQVSAAQIAAHEAAGDLDDYVQQKLNAMAEELGISPSDLLKSQKPGWSLARQSIEVELGRIGAMREAFAPACAKLFTDFLQIAMANQELLLQCIKSGQVSAAQIAAHAAAGDLDDLDTKCPWCGMSGPDYDESPMPSDICHHDPAESKK